MVSGTIQCRRNAVQSFKNCQPHFFSGNKKGKESGYCKGVSEISNDSTLNTFGGNNADEIFTTNIESDSVLIWYFAQLILYFFELNPQFKGRAAKGSGISLNKNILISNLIYHTHLSLNKNFLNDDEYLKGYLIAVRRNFTTA